MFSRGKLIFFSQIFLLSEITALGAMQINYVPINWNISTDRGNSHLEREYKYPMFEEVAPVPCDLTNSCDVLCPEDPDCDESQKQSFLLENPEAHCKGPLAFFSCGCDNFDRPEWFSVLCYVYKNPIYLGKYFRTTKKIEKFGGLKSVIDRKQYSTFNHKKNGEEIKSKVMNQLGAPIMTFVPTGDSFPSLNPLLMKVPIKDFSHTCKPNPVRYRVNKSTVCLNKITQELCQNGHILSVLPYLVQGNSFSNNSNTPIVLKDLDVLKGIKTNVTIKCVSVKLKTKKFKKQDVNYFQQEADKPCVNVLETYKTVFSNNTCSNVLTYVTYEFMLNGSDLVNLTVEYGLADLPFQGDKYDERILKNIFLKQTFSVNFYDILKKPADKRNYSKDDEVLNRGYFMGERLNFGYRHVKNSSTSWENGALGVFGFGGSCDNPSPITFGFDYFSVCRVRGSFSNCSHLRSEVEGKFEALIKGDSLAIYANLRTPYNNSLPVLRSYPSWNSSKENLESCLIPVGQDVLIRYTSTFMENGNVVHRVSGIRIDRSFRNVSIQGAVRLTSRAFFLRSSSHKDGATSRFWKRMFSPEQSENAWLYIFNAFDNVSPDEREEITFWCTFFVVFLSAVIACTDLNFSYNSHELRNSELRNLGGVKTLIQETGELFY